MSVHMKNDGDFFCFQAALAICGHLSKEFGGKFTEEFVVPHVVALITDGNWSIRKIICEIIVEVALLLG